MAEEEELEQGRGGEEEARPPGGNQVEVRNRNASDK
jgi:hypothetical protein